MRLLVTGDLHWQGANPRARTDDFMDALRAKLDEVFKIAHRDNVNAIVVPGDIFQSPRVSLSVLGAFARFLQRHSHPPILTVAGNHDLFSGNPHTIGRTPYALLHMLDMIQDLQRIPYMLSGDFAKYTAYLNRDQHTDPEPDSEPRYIVTGHGYDIDTDRDIEQYLVAREDYAQIKPAPIHIHVVHGMALPKSPGYELRHTLLADIAAQENAPDLLIVGHDHLGFGVQRLESANPNGEMVAINPGALCRLSAHPAEIARAVEVCEIEIIAPPDNIDIPPWETGKPVFLPELIPLDSARPGHEVLSRAALEAAAEKQDRINTFLGLVAQEGEARFMELRDIIEDMARREAIPDVVRREALRRIGEAREVVGA